jgi:hypothetical protein
MPGSQLSEQNITMAFEFKKIIIQNWWKYLALAFVFTFFSMWILRGEYCLVNCPKGWLEKYSQNKTFNCSYCWLYAWSKQLSTVKTHSQSHWKINYFYRLMKHIKFLLIKVELYWEKYKMRKFAPWCRAQN